MEYTVLTPLSKLKANNLWITQPKWHKAKYELTDDAFVYAKIYTEGFWHTTTIFETEDEKLTIKHTSISGLEITGAGGKVLGTIDRNLLKGTTTLTLTGGRVLTYYCESIWKADYIWRDSFNNELIRMKFGSMSGKVSVSFDKRAADIPYFAALVFIAFKLNLDNSEGG